LGFDGQYYRIIAHDPFLTREFTRHIDQPITRYRRILVPLLAYAVALGKQSYVDVGFRGVVLLFLGLGVYWLGRYVALFGRSSLWGFAFFLAPGTLAGLERASIDAVLAAITVGFVLYLREQRPYRLLVLMVMAGLCRETGFLLILGCAGQAALERCHRRLALSCLSALPAIAWYVLVQVRSPHEHNAKLLRLPLSDLFENILHHNVSYVKNGAWLVHLLYYAAVLGTLLAIAFAIKHALSSRKSAEVLAMLGFAALGLLVQPSGFWTQPYHFGRVLAPLTLLVALEYFPTGDWWRCLPACLITPGILLVSLASAARVAHQIAGRLHV
jgi:hypothetical protein